MTNNFDRDCGNLASVLTAFFDGQATPAEARFARAHLQQCARCAELWSAWEQTRTLLQNDLVSAPPGLAQRIMLACRMEGFRRLSPRRQDAAKPGSTGLPPEIVAMTLGLQSFDNFRHDEVEILPPAHLRETILNLTTRAAAADDLTFEAPAYVAPLYVEDSAQLQEVVLAGTGNAGYSARRVIHRAFAFAAPALLVFMMWPGGPSSVAPRTGSVAVAPLVESVQPVTVRSSSDLVENALNVGLRGLAAAPTIQRAPATEVVSEPVVASDDRVAREDRADGERSNRAAARADRPVAAHERAIEEAVHAREAAAETAAAVEKPAAPAIVRVAARQPVHSSAFANLMTSVRRSTPRMLTTVSLTPVVIRTSAAFRPPLSRPEATRTVNPDNDPSPDDTSDSLSGELEVAPVVDSYRAALADDNDGNI